MEIWRYGRNSFWFYALVVMINWLKKIGLSIFIYANGSLLLRLALLVLLFFGIETIYGKWQDPQLNFGENSRRYVLYVYTFIQILIVVRFIYEFKNFIWGEKAVKVVEAKKSFQNMPSSYKDILDVEKFPKLK